MAMDEGLIQEINIREGREFYTMVEILETSKYMPLKFYPYGAKGMVDMLTDVRTARKTNNQVYCGRSIDGNIEILTNF
jgi:hypothetical protein